MKRERETWVDAAKGIAILFVVLGHVVSSYHNSGLLKDAQGFNYVHTLAYSFHMPLFFALSGYLAAKSSNHSGLLQRIGHKVLCLGIPYVVFSVVTWGMKYVLASFSNSVVGFKDLLRIPLFPINHMWYIYALCFMAVIHILLEKPLRSRAAAIAAALCALGLRLLFSSTGWLTQWGLAGSIFESVINYFAWFLLGVACSGLIKQKRVSAPWAAAVAVSVGFYCAAVWWCKKTGWDHIGLDLLLGVLGIVVFSAAAMCLKGSKLLTYLGRNSLPIYLLHGVVLSAARVVLSKLGLPMVYGLVPMVVCGLVGIVVPLGCYWVCSKVKPLDFCFYPGKFIKKTNGKG